MVDKEVGRTQQWRVFQVDIFMLVLDTPFACVSTCVSRNRNNLRQRRCVSDVPRWHDKPHEIWCIIISRAIQWKAASQRLPTIYTGWRVYPSSTNVSREKFLAAIFHRSKKSTIFFLKLIRLVFLMRARESVENSRLHLVEIRLRRRSMNIV